MKTREKWYKILDIGYLRICGKCQSSFRCTGECPPNRWTSDKPDIHGTMIKACYCPKCLKQSDFGEEYVGVRIRYCDPSYEPDSQDKASST
jgi:hypothetical protein